MTYVYWWDIPADMFRRVRVLKELDHTFIVCLNDRATFSVYKEDCVIK